MYNWIAVTINTMMLKTNATAEPKPARDWLKV
jgi:hypothetical protein